ncbi:MAG: histidine triad nucleotide-binding protein [Candidatus Nanopelagicales bacterium]|nr:histidine triad nucleotide-binding protein [Candidatus Nanopelagicales bacterium]
MSTEPDCLFCKISSGVIPTDVILESDNAIAFRDIDPKAPTHVLVIPKSHYADVTDLMASNPLLASELLTLATNVAQQEGLANGYRIVTNNGEDAGQSVAHVHFHVLGGRSLSWPPG